MRNVGSTDEMAGEKQNRIYQVSDHSVPLQEYSHYHTISSWIGRRTRHPEHGSDDLCLHVHDSDAVKRATDIAASAILLVVFSPLFILTAFAIYIGSGPPVIYKQKRSSWKGSKGFDFYKFRSMVRNADDLRDNLQEHNESDGALFKIKNDPRVTVVGKFIRQYSIDELPQLFNVLKGDMSLVGPRPLPVQDLENMQLDPADGRRMRDRAKAKPGVTGLWQVCGRSRLTFHTMMTLDLYYVRNRSLLLDLRILLRTIRTVLSGDGA